LYCYIEKVVLCRFIFSRNGWSTLASCLKSCGVSSSKLIKRACFGECEFFMAKLQSQAKLPVCLHAKKQQPLQQNEKCCKLDALCFFDHCGSALKRRRSFVKRLFNIQLSLHSAISNDVNNGIDRKMRHTEMTSSTDSNFHNTVNPYIVRCSAESVISVLMLVGVGNVLRNLLNCNIYKHNLFTQQQQFSFYLPNY
ncbi:hypothetical protein T4B_10994, partial [Trichinella pseudospiralis]